MNKPKEKKRRGKTPIAYKEQDQTEQALKQLEQDDKCYNPGYGRKLEPDDPRVNYDPMAGRTGSQACANCFWFNPGSVSCTVVYGEIVPTGLSDMWMPRDIEPDIDPLPVTIVEMDERELKLGLGDQIKSLFGRKAIDLSDVHQGFKVAEINGTPIWLAWWSNNIEDRAGEIFPERALDNFVNRVDSKQMPYPELWYRHLSIPSGRAQWVGRVGHLMLAAGKFYDTEVGRKFYRHYKSSKIPYTVSHGYLFGSKSKRDGAYHSFHTYEISPMLPGEEANSITGFGVKEITMAITDAKRKDLEGIVGAELAAKYLQFGEEKSKQLEELGLKMKGLDADDTVDSTAREALSVLAKSQKDFETSVNGRMDKLVESMTNLATSIKALVDGKKEEQPPAAPPPTTPPPAATTPATPSNDERIEKLEKALGIITELAPRATMAQTTALPEGDQYVNYLKEKQNAQQAPGGLFGDILANAGFAPPPAGDGK